MSKLGSSMDLAVRLVFLVLLGLITLVAGILLLIVYVPVSAWYLWRLLDKTRALEKKVAELENKSGQS